MRGLSPSSLLSVRVRDVSSENTHACQHHRDTTLCLILSGPTQRIHKTFFKASAYPHSDHKVAEVSQVELRLGVVPLVGEAGPEAGGALGGHRQDGDGLDRGSLQGPGAAEGHHVGRVGVLAKGQLQLLTHRELGNRPEGGGLETRTSKFKQAFVEILFS